MRVFVAGHAGMVGSSVFRELHREGGFDLITAVRSEVDLRNQAQVEGFLNEAKPDAIIMAAAKVGGILANSSANLEFLMENLQIQTNLIQAALRLRVKRFIFLGSSCIYPRMSPQPISEANLLSGELEKTNEGYALAKIAGLKSISFAREQMGKHWFSLMPTNLYGVGDNYHPLNSHVVPGLIRRFDDARRSNQKEVVVWGTGHPRREFLFVDDLAQFIVALLDSGLEEEFINIGSGEEVSIADLAKRIAYHIGFEGEIIFDTAKPDGTPRKLLDISKQTALGLLPSFTLDEGLPRAIRDYRENWKE